MHALKLYAGVYYLLIKFRNHLLIISFDFQFQIIFHYLERLN